MSVSTENFVKTIYMQEHTTGADSKPGSLAKLLNISNAAATDMARKLSIKRLINYKKYQQLTLTPRGKKLALNVIRKHRLWETFLYKTLNLSLHEIHREAEHLEHLTTDFLADKIWDYLGNPEIDPHGDPIPTNKGDIVYHSENKILSNVDEGAYEITRLFSSDKDFFLFCNQNNIRIGSIIKVEKQYADKGMTEIQLENSKLILNKEFTNIIYVKQINKS